jgi:CelD/BcsL family acetyltransferase involved in cellulose biosynthesis
VPTILRLDDDAWATFVESAPDSGPFHHPVWASLIADCYGFRGFVYIVRNDRGEIAAGLPLVEVGKRRRWVSLSFSDHCGPLGSPDAIDDLMLAVNEERNRRSVTSLEVRSPLTNAPRSKVVGFRHILKLDDSIETIFTRFNRSQVQRGIRKAERLDVKVRIGARREDLVKTFYALHLARRRALGVPIQPRAFFEGLWERMIAPGFGAVFIAEVGGVPAAAAVFLCSKQQLVYKFGASDSAMWSHRPNHALFWEATKWAVDRGFTDLDFGRTDLDNEGLRYFKSGWGTVETRLVYSVFGSPPSTRMDGLVSQALSLAIRHSPEIVCQRLGEHLYHYAA